MRDFTALFQLLADLQKVLRFVVGPLRVGDLSLGRYGAVETLNYSHHQSASGNLGFCICQCFQCARPTVVCDGRKANSLMHSALANVFSNRVRRDESARGRSVRLGIDCSSGVSDVGQKRRAGLNTIFTRQSGFGQRRVKLGSVGLCALDRIREANCEGRVRGSSGTLWHDHAGLSPDARARDHHQRQNISRHAHLFCRYKKYGKKKVKRTLIRIREAAEPS